MIVIPPNTELNPKFRELIDMFNKLEERLQYPHCDGYSDQKRVLTKAEEGLIMWGII